MQDLSGQYLGRYHIIEKLGAGGMAVVYKAYDTRLERDVAIKLIRLEAFSPEVVEHMLKRFEREAKSLARMDHHYIVPIHDYGEHEGAPYLVMRYVQGGTLKNRTGKPMPYQEAARLLTPVARALAFAHQQNIVHRDVKPANILITTGGEPLLSDFGIAKILESGEAATLTGTGVGVGTPEYMAPEQWLNQISPQTDIYSLGVVFYELVTGRKPYTADTPAAVLLKQASDPLPRPGDFVPGLPETVEKALYKALAKKPEDRFPSMDDFAAVLEKFTQEPTLIGTKQEDSTRTSQPAVISPAQAGASALPVEAITYDYSPGGNVFTPSPTPPGAAPRPAAQPKKSLPKWLLTGGAVLVGLCILAVIGGAIYGVYSLKGASASPTTTALLPIQPTVGENNSLAEPLQPPGSKGVIKIASQSPLSGKESGIGISLRNAAELSVEQNKSQLESMGFSVEFMPYDDKSTPDVGVANAENIVSDPNVLCVVGHWNSEVQIPVSEVYHAAGLANISAANTNPNVTDRGYMEISRIIGRDDMQGPAAAQFSQKYGFTSAYIFHDGTDYGQYHSERFKLSAEEVGIKILGSVRVEEQANLDVVLDPMMKANPDLIYYGGLYDKAAVLFTQAREKGFWGPLLGPDGLDSPDLIRLGGSALLEGKGIFYTVTGLAPSHYPQASKFVDDYKNRFGEDPQPYSAQSYDAANLCLTAILKAVVSENDFPSRAMVAKHVRTLVDFQGITGTINFDPNGDLIEANYYVMQVVSDDPNRWHENEVIAAFPFPSPAAPPMNTGEINGELKLAILTPLTGPFPTFGASTRDGAQMAVDEWNAKGGVLGMKIVPLIKDSQCTADPAVAGIKMAIDEGARFVIGEVCSVASIPVSEITNAAGVLQISPVSSNPGVTVDSAGNTKNYVFRACFTDPYQGGAMAKFAYDVLQARTAFVLFDPDNIYSAGLTDSFIKYFSGMGGTIVGDATYKTGETDFTPILEKVAAVKPDVIYLPDYYSVVNMVGVQAKKMGILTPFLGGDGWDSPDLDLKALDGGFFTSHYSPEDPRPEVQDFIKAYFARYQTTPDALAVLAYDATNLMLSAIQQTGNPDPGQVSDALMGMKFFGVTGVIVFDNQHNPTKTSVIMHVGSDGIHYHSSVNP